MEGVWRQLLPALDVALRERGILAWVVGGTVRDALLGRSIRDVDLMVAGSEDVLDEVVRAVPDIWRQGIGRLRHDTVRVVVDGEGELHLDVTRMHGESVAEDLAARDFTCNAMALPLSGVALLPVGEARAGALEEHVIDPLGGIRDLREGRLRLASAAAFVHDPGRILRAARFIAGLRMAPTTETDEAARQAVPEIERLHPARVHEELNALFALPQLAVGVHWLHEVGALEHLAVLPPTLQVTAASARELDVLERALALAAQLHPAAPVRGGSLAPLATLLATRGWYAQPLWAGYPRFLVLPWSEVALSLLGRPQTPLAASGRPATRWFPWVMPVPGGQIERCAWASVRSLNVATRLLAQPAPPLAELRRFFAMEPTMEDYAVDALVVALVRAVAEAESLGNQSGAGGMVARAAKIIGEFFADEQRFVPERLLTGRELNQLLPPDQWPQIRRVLRAVREAQLDGRITTHEEAVSLARELEGADGDRQDAGAAHSAGHERPIAHNKQD